MWCVECRHWEPSKSAWVERFPQTPGHRTHTPRGHRPVHREHPETVPRWRCKCGCGVCILCVLCSVWVWRVCRVCVERRAVQSIECIDRLHCHVGVCADSVWIVVAGVSKHTLYVSMSLYTVQAKVSLSKGITPHPYTYAILIPTYTYLCYTYLYYAVLSCLAAPLVLTCFEKYINNTRVYLIFL